VDGNGQRGLWFLIEIIFRRNETVFFYGIPLFSWVVGLFLICLPFFLIITRWVDLRSIKTIIYLIAFLSVGVWFIYEGHLVSQPNPYSGMITQDKDLIALLEHGKIAEATVLKKWYHDGRPPGWMILYTFNTSDSNDKKSGVHFGCARGPKPYYNSFSKGDRVIIIYCPDEPDISSEIYEFLNDPNYRLIFKQTGKMELFEKLYLKFQDKLVNNPDWTWWYNQSRND
jgi:hypothetical protein